MSTLSFSRALMGLTLGFHMIFASLGVGMPMFIALAHFLGLRRNDPDLLRLSERWTKGFTILFAVGTVTGTVVGFQFNLLWPHFIALAGRVIALPLFMETFAFLVEAVFFGLYVYGKKWFANPWVHWAMSLPIALASSASAFAITCVNSFMNAPAGFDVVAGQAVNIRPLAAMFNPATAVKAGHVMITAYTTVAFVLAAVAAWKLLHGEQAAYHRKALHVTMIAGLMLACVTAFTGDASAKWVARYQPVKLAAAEGLFETKAYAPLALGGLPDAASGRLKGAIEVPGALSFLAWANPSKPVQGLNDFPKDVWPPLFIHMTFDLMVGIGTLMIAAGAYYVWRRWRRRGATDQRAFLWGVVALGVLGMVGIQAGWVTAEVGRAPWILWGMMKTVDAVTDSPSIPAIFFFFLGFYTLIGAACIYLLRWYFRKHPLLPGGGRENARFIPGVQEAYGHD